jgi:hypothetical protein
MIKLAMTCFEETSVDTPGIIGKITASPSR